MLSIGQLASYAGVTRRTVRHYHQIGLPEPERDASGYRTYGAAAVLLLIRVRTLAEAGVPLALVPELLEADEETFAESTRAIDAHLRRQIRELQEHRRRIAQLASGDSLAVPRVVEDYLARIRALGLPETLVEAERDAWILVAARYPSKIADFMADKVQQLEDQRTVRIYQLIGRIVSGEVPLDDGVVRELVDLLVGLIEEAAAGGQLEAQDLDLDDSTFVQLLDSLSDEHQLAVRLREALAERGWTGWTRIERG